MDELKDRKYFAGAPAHLHDGAPACENDSAPAHVSARGKGKVADDGCQYGKVAIVGAGCGVGTLTLRAAEL